MSNKVTEMNDFRARLQQAATWAGVGESQASMATSLNLNRQTINRWFQGGEPNAEMLLHIARSWGVDAEWLKTGQGAMLPEPTEDQSSEERELVRDWRKASPQVRQAIRAMVRAARKSVVVIAALLPPLLAPSPSDAGVLHNLFSADGHTTHWMRFRRWFRTFSSLRNSDCKVSVSIALGF